MITISFYSYKGGVGRSLALTNLGVYLAQFGATVAMADFDLEAPGLHYKVKPGSAIELGSGGLANLLAKASLGTPPADLDYDIALDITQHVEPPAVEQDGIEQPHGRLLLIPAGNPLTSNYWTDLAAIDWSQLFTGPRRAGVETISRLRQHLIEAYNPDVLLVDSRTGITPGGGVSTTLLPDVVVMLLLNSEEHLDGSRLVVSAIAQSAHGEGRAPAIVPVLSRYTSPTYAEQLGALEIRKRNAVIGRVLPDTSTAAEDIPLAELRAALTRDLDPRDAENVTSPLVLHSDLALQLKEGLSFGPYATGSTGANAGALLDDYLRLFASLVPREMVTRYLEGVRSRVRGIILDRPEDAVRTLENLAALVGDEAVFLDLVKVHALRRDTRSMLFAAERLHDVHGQIVVNIAISQALRESVVGRSGRVPPEGPNLSAGFLEDYWRRAAPDDVEWGAALARALISKNLEQHALTICEELVADNPDPDTVTQVVSALIAGDPSARTLAAQFALAHFDAAESSSEFLRVTSLACRHQPSQELAERIVEASAFRAVPDSLAVDVLVAAGRPEEAGALLVEILTTSEPRDPHVERLAGTWSSLVARNKSLRVELQERNPRMLEAIDSYRDELPRSRRRAR